MKKSPLAHGIALKKRYGQHFLQDQVYVDHMLEKVTLTPESSVFEIGCGDGFLTRSILKQSIKRLWVFEIDPEWADYVSRTYPDERMTMLQENYLEVSCERFEKDAPWILLANLPYQVTFPILQCLRECRKYLQEGVIMVQEEVAQKLLKTSGRGYGFPSLYFQHFFYWEQLDKVPPQAFRPPPKVVSRLLYFRPREVLDTIPDEEGFWVFIKRCFHQPRRTLKNNLQAFHYDLDHIDEKTLQLRAQQLSKQDLLAIWKLLIR